MAINKDQLELLNTDYFSQKGKQVKNFVCPITGDDEPSAELCNGHILNDAIIKASGATIIQYKDIDNYFGRVLENELVKWLNLPLLSTDELFQMSYNLRVTIPDGQTIEAFYSRQSKVKGKFPQINLYGADKTVVSQPFLKTQDPKLWEFKDAQVEGLVRLSDTAFTGSLLKSAFLTLFRMFGYSYALSACAVPVRNALTTFYREKANIEQASKYFGPFHDAVSVELNGIFHNADTLEDGSFLMHHRGKSESPKTIFALTCLFSINDKTFLVTLPFSESFAFDISLYKDYVAFLADHSMIHTAYAARLHDGIIERDVRPLPIKDGKSVLDRQR